MASGTLHVVAHRSRSACSFGSRLAGWLPHSWRCRSHHSSTRGTSSCWPCSVPEPLSSSPVATLPAGNVVSLPTVVAAAMPMQVLVVWLYFALGRAWSRELDDHGRLNADDRLPFLAERVLRPDHVRAVRRGLRQHGSLLTIVTRFAIFPTGLVAAAAGSAGVPPRRYRRTQARLQRRRSPRSPAGTGLASRTTRLVPGW